MASTNKTANLQLNSWLATDKPKREDFTSDNLKIDTAVTNHINDQTVHITAADRAKIDAPYVVEYVTGTGAASVDHTLSFSPQWVLVYMDGSPFNEYDSVNDYTICSGGIVCSDFIGATPGISLNGTTLTLSQSQTTATNGVFHNFNKSGEQYVIIAFK